MTSHEQQQQQQQHQSVNPTCSCAAAPVICRPLSDDVTPVARTVVPAALPLWSVSLAPGCAAPPPAGTELGASVTVAPEPVCTKVAVVALPVGAAVGAAVPAEELVGVCLLARLLAGLPCWVFRGLSRGLLRGLLCWATCICAGEIHRRAHALAVKLHVTECSSAVGTRVQGYSPA